MVHHTVTHTSRVARSHRRDGQLPVCAHRHLAAHALYKVKHLIGSCHVTSSHRRREQELKHVSLHRDADLPQLAAHANTHDSSVRCITQ